MRIILVLGYMATICLILFYSLVYLCVDKKDKEHPLWYIKEYIKINIAISIVCIIFIIKERWLG